MYYSNNRRQFNRYYFCRPIQINIGSQVVINGRVRDVSTQSAFVEMKYSVYLQREDELQFKIQMNPDSADEFICGTARISRVSPGDGAAIYFTDLSKEDAVKLEQLIASNKG